MLSATCGILGRRFAVPLKSSAVLRIEFVLASYKILLDFARVHATTLLQLASRTIEFISNPPIQTVKISKRD
jgi:hypothetical protein